MHGEAGLQHRGNILNDNYGIKSLQDPVPSDQVYRHQPQRLSFVAQGSHYQSASQTGLMKAGCGSRCGLSAGAPNKA